MKKVLVAVVVLALLGAFGWYLSRRILEARQTPERRRRGGPVAVEVAPVTTGTIRDVAQFTGSLSAKSQFVVAPKIGGRLERLNVDIGDSVQQNQLVAVLDSGEYFQQVEQARAELKVAEATVLETKSSLGAATREFNRVRALFEKKIATEAELDAAKAQFEAKTALHQVAKARVMQRQAELKAAEVRLSYTQICAAWQDPDETGRPRIVGERFVDEGTMLRANDPIVSILDLSTVTAVIHVIERDYSGVRIGQEAEVTTDAFPGRRFTGRIVRVAPLLRETSRQARVELRIPNADAALKPGMFVRAALQFAEHQDTTVVPVSALTRREGKPMLFLADLEAKKARLVPVTLGIVNGELAEVLSPRIEGHVVTLGQHLLSDGTAIVLPGKPTSRPAGGADRRPGPGGERRGGDRP